MKAQWRAGVRYIVGAASVALVAVSCDQANEAAAPSVTVRDSSVAMTGHDGMTMGRSAEPKTLYVWAGDQAGIARRSSCSPLRRRIRASPTTSCRCPMADSW